jgi:predicted signal transduction protein with EAL and GGDEF domain
VAAFVFCFCIFVPPQADFYIGALVTWWFILFFVGSGDPTYISLCGFV